MVPNPAERLTTRDALDHPWLSDDAERPSSPIKNVDDMALVPRKPETGEPVFRVDDLLGLQQTIAVCLRSAFATYQDVPGVSRALRQSAVLCRSQLLENAKLLRKIEHTASSVLDIHDDLELAVDAGQSALARELVAVWKSTGATGAPDNSSLSHFSVMTRPCWLRRAVRNRYRHAIEQASRRWRGGQRDDSARTRRKV
jgi:hypothetical protein